MTGERRPRSLILAGGGLKVAFQAGVLQVLLDEAGLRFDHVDGTSAGVFNLAMLCQGMSGSAIAENWRRVEPLEVPKPKLGPGLLSHDRFVRNVVRRTWGVDFGLVRTTSLDATFNVFDFTDQELVTLAPWELTEELFVACVSLPGWYPPVVVEGHTYVDAVFASDANLDAALERGAKEIVVIWTVSRRGEWRGSPYAVYFQIVEQAANWSLKRDLAAIADRHPEVEVKEIAAEVPINYLVTTSRRQLREMVQRGIEAGRAWCRAEGYPLPPPPPPRPDGVFLSFRERMRGHLAAGERDPRTGALVGRRQGSPLELALRVTVADLELFLTDARHEASIAGTVRSPALGPGTMTVAAGSTFNLFVDGAAPAHRRMTYRLFLSSLSRGPLTLCGVKELEDDPGLDEWADATTLFVRVYEGTLGPGEEAEAVPIAAGVARISLGGFLRQLASFSGGPTARDALRAIGRFDVFFLGRLWDVYLRGLLPWAPF